MLRSIAFCALALGAAAFAPAGLAAPLRRATVRHSDQSPTTPQWDRSDPDGLEYVDTVVGTGETPGDGQVCVMQYVGTLEDGGTQFDASKSPFRFKLGAREVIPAWDRGIRGMKVGGKRSLRCPPGLAYGPEGAGGVIPPNAVLLFDVELEGVEDGAGPAYQLSKAGLGLNPRTGLLALLALTVFIPPSVFPDGNSPFINVYSLFNQ